MYIKLLCWTIPRKYCNFYTTRLDISVFGCRNCDVLYRIVLYHIVLYHNHLTQNNIYNRFRRFLSSGNDKPLSIDKDKEGTINRSPFFHTLYKCYVIHVRSVLLHKRTVPYFVRTHFGITLYNNVLHSWHVFSTLYELPFNNCVVWRRRTLIFCIIPFYVSLISSPSCISLSEKIMSFRDEFEAPLLLPPFSRRRILWYKVYQAPRR